MFSLSINGKSRFLFLLLAVVFAFESNAKAGRNEIEGNSDSETTNVLQKTSEVSIPVRPVTHGPEYHWFGYYDKREFDPTNRYVLANQTSFEGRGPTGNDTIKVGYKVTEGTRSRVQNYEGVCISRRGGATLAASFTVRKISFGEGVERVFPLYSTNIDSIEVVRRGRVRRAKLYYLRDRRGKSARIVEDTNYKAPKA